jgi:hypothetical protein
VNTPPLALTDEQLRTLRHMLGIDKPEQREPQPYRNYYCADPRDEHLLALEAAGAVRMYRRCSHYEWWTCTDAGYAAAIRSHRAIRHRKSRRVYSRFLDISDTRPDLTFREFITSPEYREARRDA